MLSEMGVNVAAGALGEKCHLNLFPRQQAHILSLSITQLVFAE